MLLPTIKYQQITLWVFTCLLLFYSSRKDTTTQRDTGRSWDAESSEDEIEFRRIINIYLEGRNRNLTNTQIARKEFGVEFPNLNHVAGEMHSFPLLTDITLMMWSDWLFIKEEVPLLDLSSIGIAPIYTGKHKFTRKGKSRAMKDGDVIFVRSDDVEAFAKEIHPRLKHRYILMSHHSDISVPQGNLSRALLEDPKLIRWFAQNPNIQHQKLEPIPIGLMRQHHPDGVPLQVWEDVLAIYTDKREKKDFYLYVNFTPRNSTNGFDQTRFAAYNAIKNKKFAHIAVKSDNFYEDKLNGEQYLQDLKRSQFVLSPPGLGEDCHRTWESIMLGAVPIVMGSEGLNPLWSQLPVLTVNDLTQIEMEDMRRWRKGGEMRRDAALAPFWFNRIDSFRNK